MKTVIKENDRTYDEIRDLIVDEKLPVMCHKHAYQVWVLSDATLGCVLCVRDANKEGKETKND